MAWRPYRRIDDRRRGGALRSLHGLSALAVAIFLMMHVGNHIAGLAGYGIHIRYMTLARPFYRNILEPLLLALLGWQATSGVVMALRGWGGRQGLIPWMQAGSGLYLAAFLIIHISAVLRGRAAGLDTNFYFAAAGFHAASWPWFFAPYYGLAALALFTHVGCALFWRSPLGFRHGLFAAFFGAGLILAVLIPASLAGLLYSVAIPERYLSAYDR